VATSRFFPATSGPGSPTTGYSGPFRAGIGFRCIAPRVQWLQGYYAWVTPGGDVTPQTFALWAVTAAAAGTLIPGSAALSGTLLAGQWNYVPLGTPVPLAPATYYVAQRGWTVTGGGGFPDTNSQFSTGGPYVSGLTSGSLFAYSAGTAGGTAGTTAPYGRQQGLFDTATTNASASLVNGGSSSANFWTDVLVSDAAPAGYSGTYELDPNNIVGNEAVTLDLNVNYNVAMTFALSAACPVIGIKMLSPPGASGLPTRASIYSVTAGGLGGAELAAITAPAWSGAAGTNWVTALFSSPPILPAGTYRVSVYNANGTLPGGWNAKDSVTGAFGAGGPLAAGIINGPLSAPGVSAAPLCYDYNGSLPGAVPPYNAGTTEPGQCVFGQDPSGLLAVPWLYAGPASGSNPQNYFVSPLIGQPVTLGGTLAPDGGTSRYARRRLLW
jgi:hypothetical protein